MDDEWIVINQTNSDEAVIDIDGYIGDDFWGESENTAKKIKAKLKQISNLKTKKITVNINSLGGSLNDGFAIHDALAAHPAEIIVNINGFTASAATLIAQAGDVRRMSDNALFLIHQSILGIGYANETELEEALSDAKSFNNRIINLYVKRSDPKQSPEKIRDLVNENYGHGTWLSSDDAKEYGLIDEAFEPMDAAAIVTDWIQTSNKFELLNKYPLPKIEKMNDVKKPVDDGKVGESNEVTNPTNEESILDKIKALFTTRQTDDGLDPEPEPELAVNKVDDPINQEPESEGDPEPEPELAVNKVDDPINQEPESEEVVNLKKKLEEKEKELAEANAALAKADAPSTKIEGKIAAEDEGMNAEKEGLDADIQSLRDVHNGKRTV